MHLSRPQFVLVGRLIISAILLWVLMTRIGANWSEAIPDPTTGTIAWLIVPLIPSLWVTAGPAVVWLLFAGGVIYSLGALVYGFRWPGRRARIYGYHEHFHTATIIAAAIHQVAVWMVVV